MNTTSDRKPEGFFQKVKYVLSHISAEPVLVLFYFPYVMLLLVNGNLLLDKSCRVNLKLDESICDGLSARNASMYNKTDEEAVQKLVTTMNIWRNVCQGLFPIIFLSFMGSWSDKHKRIKPSFIFPVFGAVLKVVGLFISLGFFYQINMEITGAIETIPATILGGPPTLSMGMHKYVSTISSPDMLTLRIGFVNLCNLVSFTLGIASGGILLQVIGYIGSYSIALSLYVISILYTVFFVQEIKSEQETNRPSVLGNLKDFFNFKHIIATAKSTFKKREKNYRLRIILLFLLGVMEQGAHVGVINLAYLYTRIRFQWSEVEFSIFYTYHLILNVTGLLIGLAVFSRILKLDDALLGTIGCLAKVISSIIIAFAPNTLIFYLAVLIEMYATVTNVAIKSIIVKLIPKEEFGKTLSMLSIFETLSTLIYGPVYNILYTLTMDSLPGSFYLLGGGLASPSIVIFFWLYIQHRKDKKEKLVE